MRRLHRRGHTNILKCLLIHTGGFNLGLLMRQLIGVGTPRGLQGRLVAGMTTLLALIRSLWGGATGQAPPPHRVSSIERHVRAASAVMYSGARRMVSATGC